MLPRRQINGSILVDQEKIQVAAEGMMIYFQCYEQEVHATTERIGMAERGVSVPIIPIHNASCACDYIRKHYQFRKSPPTF